MPKNLTDASTYSSPIAVPVDSDPRNAASVETPFQQLANRTKYLADRVGGSGGGSEWVYDDAPRSRTRIVSPFAFMEGKLATGDAQLWTVAAFVSTGTGYSRTSQADRAQLVADISHWLPIFANLTRVQVLVAPGAARGTVGDRVTVSLFRQTPSFSTPAIPVADGPIGEATDDGTTNVQVIDTGVIDEDVDRASQLCLRIVAGADGGTNKDDVHSILLTYTVLGPNAF